MNSKTLLAALALVVVVALALGLRSCRRSGSLTQLGAQANLAVYGSIGGLVAEETAKFLGGKGDVFLVTPGAFADAYRKIAEEFASVCRDRGLEVVGTEAVEMEIPHGGLEHMVEPPFVKADAFMAVADGHLGVDAIVCMAGTPRLPEAEARKMARAKAKLIVLEDAPGAAHLKHHLLSGAVSMAVARRQDPALADAVRRGDVRAYFEALYRVVTPENADSLPDF